MAMATTRAMETVAMGATPKGKKPPTGRDPKNEPPPPPPDDEDEEEEDGEDEEAQEGDGSNRQSKRDQGRVREAEKIELLQFPQGAQWRAWRSHTLQAIVSAAGRQDDRAHHWIRKCETEEPDSLDTPGSGWISLDRTLAAAITNISHGEIGRVLTQRSTIELNNGRIVRGRVLLALVSQYYASGKKWSSLI